MRVYDKKVLFALVVAYKNGIIKRTPLKRWIERKIIIKNLLKYVALIVSFLHVIIMINEGYIIDLEQNVRVGGGIVDAYRLYNVILVIPMLISLYKLVTYIQKITFVNRTMANYKYDEGHISALDKVTFKIKA
jgi:hypothetical protein